MQRVSRASSRTILSQSLLLQRIALLANCGLLIAVLGCNAANNLSQSAVGGPVSDTSKIQVAVSPGIVMLSPLARQQFTATVKGTSNTAVLWAASAGSISTNGAFTAPVAANGADITITATSVIDSAQHGMGVVTIQAAQKLAVSTSSLSKVTVNTPYHADLAASGGTPPYQWAISAGSLPSGILLQSATGALAGQTIQRGAYAFAVKVTDAASHSATGSLTLAVAETNNSNFDGPAELPRIYLQTTLADTPAPGSTISVPAGGDFQAALDNANCGDTIALQAGATFSAGKYIVPAKACDDEHWIIIRTSAPDKSLPPEGSRMTPCYTGVASLPGRPQFACNSPRQVLATISYLGTGKGPLIFADGANHYRLLGLEITRAANGVPVTALVAHEKNGSRRNIVLDRLYVHGTPKDETRRGVSFSGGISMTVQDSYFSDFHCNVAGTCTDSQAVSGGVGSEPMGPYKIVNNFLEAAGEDILIGGDAATETPADIEIRFNHLFKPRFWLQGQPGFTAPAFIVKNHFELKNAQRVLFDSNVLENNWGGFSQHGYSVLLTPKNQDIGGVSVCPNCQVTDVTIRYVKISHVAGAFVIGNGETVLGAVAKAGERYSIHDVMVDDLNGVTYMGRGTFAQVGTVADPLLQFVEINHVTAFPNHVLFNIGAPATVKIPGFIFSNSIVGAGESPVTSTGGGVTNCAHNQIPVTTVSSCFMEATFSPNAVLDSPYPSSKWPVGNSYYSKSQIGFVNYNNGNGGDYHLLPSSPAVGAASDGTDLGANVDAVLNATSGVE